MKIYLVWHIAHFPDESGAVRHFDVGDDVPWHGDDDDFRVLGVFATEAEAEVRIVRARQSPGFRDEPNCFQVEEYLVGKELWVDGYFTY